MPETSPPPHPSLPRFNPFPGLRSFQPDEDYLFFGREKQIAELLTRLREHRFIAVVGTSGSGKSSLVRAGLLPELQGGTMNQAGSRWEIALMRPGGSPIMNLARALGDAGLGNLGDADAAFESAATLLHSGRGLIEAVRQAKLEPGANLLLVVDQFEELFRFRKSGGANEETAEAFVRLLLQAASQTEQPIYVVLTMRSDYLGDCSQFRGLAEAVNDGEYLIPRLSRDQLRAAIEGPARVAGGAIANRLVQQLLNDVGADQDQLPVLQHALMRSWDSWIASGDKAESLDLEHYEATGGMLEALSRHADEIYAGLPKEHLRAVCGKLFRALTERGADNRGIRHPTRFDQLCAITGAEAGDVREVIEAFRAKGRTFLMPAGETPIENETVIDISHESLMRVWRRLDRWVEEESQSARVYRRLADTAQLHAEGKADLYRDPDLQIAVSWRQAEQPNAAWAERYHADFGPAMEFLEKSRQAAQAAQEAREAARRRELEQAKALAAAEHARAEQQLLFASNLKWLVRGLGLVAMLAITAFLFALAARRQAQENANRAAASERTAQANAKEAERLTGVASERANDSQRSLVQLNSSTAIRMLESGDPIGAMPWMAEALRLVETNAAQASIHRTRLNMLLSRSPRLLLLLTNAPGSMNSVEFSKNGKRLLASSQAGRQVRVWETESGSVIRVLTYAEPVRSARFTPDGEVVLASLDSTVVVRRIDSGAELYPPLAHGGRLYESDISPDGQLIATGSGDLTARVWDARTGKPITPPLRHDGYVWGTRFSSDGRWVATAGYSDRTARIWDARTGEPVIGHFEHPRGVSAVAFSPDMRHLLTAGLDGNARLWGISTGMPLAGAFPHSSGVSDVEFSPDGAKFLTGTRSQIAWLWDAVRGRPIGSQLGSGIGGKHFIVWASFSPDGALLAASFFQGGAQVWETATGTPATPVLAQSGSSRALAFSPEGRRLAVGNADGTVRVWDLVDESGGSRMLELNGAVQAEFSRDGSRISTLSGDGSARVWSAETFEPVSSPLLQGAWRDGSFSAAADRFAALSALGSVSVWDTRTGKEIFNRDSADVMPDAFQFSRDGKLLALGGDKHGISVWEIDTNRQLWHTTNKVDRLAFSPDSQRLAIAHSASGVAVVDARDGISRSSAFAWATNLARLEFSPASDLLLGFAGNEALVWKPDAAAAEPKRLRHQSTLSGAAFSADGRWIATCSNDRTARIWDVDTGAPRTAFLPHDILLEQIALSPDQRYLVTATVLGQLRLWETATGQPILPVMEHGAKISRLAFGSDSRTILSSGWNGNVRLWSLPTAERDSAYLQSAARLLAASRVDGTSSLVPLSPAEQLREFERLRSASGSRANAAFSTAELLRWHRLRAAESMRSEQWFAARFHFERAFDLDQTNIVLREQAELAKRSHAATPQIGEPARASTAIPERSPAASVHQLDLTAFYNSPLGETWHVSVEGNHLASLKPGLNRYAGALFDVRGVIQLAGATLRGGRFPEAVRGIPAKVKCQRLQALHAVGFGTDTNYIGSAVGLLRALYADGQTLEFPIRYGDHVWDWWYGSQPPKATNSVRAWVGTNPAVRNAGSISLFKTTWDNPRPEVQIESIDYVSTMGPTAPFLVGLTLEP